jgi:hypothetical protein
MPCEEKGTQGKPQMVWVKSWRPQIPWVIGVELGRLLDEVLAAFLKKLKHDTPLL